jgi:hypothetical protein
MAFYNEEYSKACRLWIDNNGEFYRHFTDAVKQLRLSGMLHVYDFALTSLQDRPQSIKVGNYGELVWKKYETIHSDFGVRSLISWPISSSWFEKKSEYAYSATSWLILGDFYETLVLRSLKSYQLGEYDNKEVSLSDLITRFLIDSTEMGAKTISDWYKFLKDIEPLNNGSFAFTFSKILERFVKKLEGNAKPDILLPLGTHDEGRGMTESQSSLASMLKCNEDKKKAAVIKAIADEIKSNNTGERIAFIKLALEKNAMIDPKLSFSPFYEALTESINPFMEGEKPVSRVYSSKIYSASVCLLNRTDDNCRNEKEKIQLIELNRICDVLKVAGNNA